MIAPPAPKDYRPRTAGPALRAARPLPKLCQHFAPADRCTQCRAPLPSPERGVEKQEAQLEAAKVIAKMDRRGRVKDGRGVARLVPSVSDHSKLPPPPRVPKEARRAVLRLVPPPLADGSPRHRIKNGKGQTRWSRGKYTPEQLAEIRRQVGKRTAEARAARVMLDGVEVVLARAAEKHGLAPVTAHRRIAKGWTVRQALGLDPPPPAPKRVAVPRKDNDLLTHEGVTKTITEWAREREMPRGTLQDRIKRGWPSGEALGLVPHVRKNARKG